MLKKINRRFLILKFNMFQKLLFAIVLFPSCLFAQEVVTPLAYNPILKAQYQLQQQKSKATTDTLNLPFFDDFSYDKIYPSTKYWTDSFVFINNSFGQFNNGSSLHAPQSV
jgi:hypothetical protein